MDPVDAQDEVLNWAPGATRFDRMEFLKKYLRTLNSDELKSAKLLASRQANNYKRKLAEEDDASAPSASAPSSSKALRPSFWWETWKKEDIYALDVEMVSLVKKPPGSNKYAVEAATVAIVNFDGTETFKWKIYHAPGSFKVNTHTKRINGFRTHSLKDGISKEQVIDAVKQKLTGKLVIVCGGEKDMQTLDLSTTQFDSYDIQFYWTEKLLNQHGVFVTQPIGLRHIYGKYYGVDIQAGTHSAEIDARATMQLFREKYIRECKEKSIYDKINPEPFENFPRLPKLF